MFLDFPLAVTAPILAIFISYFANLGLVYWKTTAILDYPNSRSLHETPVPRIGGLGLLLGVMLSWGLVTIGLPVSVWLGIAVLIGISIADDLWKMPVRYRLFVHGLVAAAFAFFIVDTQDWSTQLYFTLAIIWMTNLYNFMDGSDGLAGGMTLIGFGYYGLAAYLSNDIDFAVINLSIAAAALGFLFHNFYPARIFLGDSGAIPLGYMAAVMGILGWLHELWSLWVPLLIFSPFITDASVTLIKRLCRGEKIWLAHREHYYQRLVQGGLGHRNTALLGYGLMLVAGACAVWMNTQDMRMQSIIVTIWCGIYLGLMLIADLGKKTYSGGI
ncbi:MAG: glycosyltransferase family 4 protein [Nitrosomonas sp.]|nr:glycosyltransferase family 4 protein [Nitrosomonas sp.]MCW5607611.1 glycosyltransferase family 4 protein [Nitrosomonas sp.]